ncbi:hypothetical protein C1876_04105 [Eggerthella sinensis]|uniref:5-methylcytosine-specific restriction endonuclease system specificity protein McrC n=2 Tax=Eggerthella sinensis TaxID=242230 RepID=A0A3N0J0M2_9ACTN|nr:hypothetical protein C1876_04105 [Eggerthella sinensis]RNM42707.1 hypothetical protein DMP09_03665 [Eggerthella sinensis]
MLCYAWSGRYLLDECLTGEAGRFEGVEDLLSYLVAREAKNVAQLGLAREYVSFEACTASPRGPVNMKESFSHVARLDQKLVCGPDEYTTNNDLNGIVAHALMGVCSEHAETRRLVRAAYPSFEDIDPVAPTEQVLSRIVFNRTTSRYRFVISLCSLLYRHTLPLEGTDGVLMSDSERTTLNHIFEKFARAFYRKELPRLKGSRYVVFEKNKPIAWATRDSTDICPFMPSMEADIWIETISDVGSSRLFIIDAKYYREALRDGSKFKTENLYQIYSYMSNARTASLTKFHEVHGCLLYPLNGRRLCEDVVLSEGSLHVRTVDLDASWQDVESQMLEIFNSMDCG